MARCTSRTRPPKLAVDVKYSVFVTQDTNLGKTYIESWVLD
jgi:hypothetical protein